MDPVLNPWDLMAYLLGQDNASSATIPAECQEQWLSWCDVWRWQICVHICLLCNLFLVKSFATVLHRKLNDCFFDIPWFLRQIVYLQNSQTFPSWTHSKHRKNNHWGLHNHGIFTQKTKTVCHCYLMLSAGNHALEWCTTWRWKLFVELKLLLLCTQFKWHVRFEGQ